MKVAIGIDDAFQAVSAAIAARRIPGAVLGILDATGHRTLRAGGFAQTTPFTRPMDTHTWFDLASLTKVVFTTPAILQLHETGRINLDDPLTTVMPDLQQYKSDSWIRQVTFAQCLSHQTSFPAVEPIYTYGCDPSLLRAFVLQRDWTKGPAVYSDINFILLGIALERIHEKRLRQLPVDAGFSFSADASQCAATEYCTWRETILCGDVHDENCHALQGAGHAGLFGTADSILDYAQGLLSGNTASAASIALMRTPVTRTRTLGWEYKHDGWQGGSSCSDTTIGHTGFTGTGLWIDFDNNCAWTLLTNRVHPSRHTQSNIVQLRIQVGDCLYCS